ncbi:MAG: type IV pili methyl-accepting chemotaxis transducer N-terminal domain-containing protein [Pseudomonadota bacterium]
MLSRRNFIAAVAMTGSVALPPVGALANGVDAAQEAKRKINIAGRQRMLTQRMAKAITFCRLGIDVEMHLDQAVAAHALFDRSLKGLRFGSADLGLNRETNGRVIDGLGRVNGLWLGYGAAVQACIDSRGADDAAFAAVMEQNLGILKEMNKTVGLTERAYGGSEIPLHLAIAINIAGRQRMLSQKMSKETGMIGSGWQGDASSAALANTIELFQSSLDALRNGMSLVGIQQPKTADVRQQLATVAELWGKMRPLVDNAAAGGAADRETLQQVAALNDPLLKEMNKAVFAYEAES